MRTGFVIYSKGMQTSDFDYRLPPSFIAQHPIGPRDHSRLMVVDRTLRQTQGKHFYDIVEYLRKGDVLVWNNSKVFKARLFGDLVSSDGKKLFEHTKKVEIFLVRAMENKGVWKVLAKPGKHVQLGTRVRFTDDFQCDVIVKEKDGTILVQFADDEKGVRAKANQYGEVPLPPYVKDEKHELETYQTIYARNEGSVAAPTAGFHFTEELIKKLKDKGVEFAEVTLHVGLGTFLPVKTERIEDHTMHSEWVELDEANAEKINRAKREGKRVVVVGTTTVRTLEGIAQLTHNNRTVEQLNSKSDKRYMIDDNATHLVRSYCGDINMFITQGFEFKVVDALITNFHLPKSTLLILVCAFAGDRKFMLDCYQKAINEGYRFYSFGDAMFIT